MNTSREHDTENTATRHMQRGLAVAVLVPIAFVATANAGKWLHVSHVKNVLILV